MAEKKTDPGNEKPLFTLLSDHPIESGEGKCIDLLDLHERLRVHLDTLRHPLTVTPFSIAFYGDWGTGKTSAMRWLESQLNLWNVSALRKKQNAHKDTTEKYPHLTPVWFYPWKYHKREDVWRGIIAEVILATLTTGSKDTEDFSQRAVHVAKRYGKFLGASFLHILANTKIKARNKTTVGVPGAAKNETIAGIELNGQAVRDIYDEYQKASQPHAPFLNDFEEEMKHWVEQTFDDESRRLVLFIDDLDRCLPEVALEVLEALKLYLNIPGLLFVAGLDDHVISQIIIGHYKKHEVDEHKARQYLAKIFQVEYHMEPSDTKAAGFLGQRIAALNALTDGEWNRCLPDEASFPNETIGKYRPAVENALRTLGSSNPREFTRLLNSLLVRAVAARQMEVQSADTTSELRFAQGAQIFLIERFLIRDLALGPARRNPLLNTRFCQWLEKLSATRRDHPEFVGIFTTTESTEDNNDHFLKHSNDPFSTPSVERRTIPEFQEIEILTENTPNASEALRILHKEAWDLLLIPFDPAIAAATATEAIATRRTNLDTSPNSISVRLIRRNGEVVPWSEARIEIAVKKAFLSIKQDPAPAVEVAKGVTIRVLREGVSFIHIEDIQDMVQEELMRQGHFKVASHYVLYRTERARLRAEQDSTEGSDQTPEQTSAQIINAAIRKKLNLPKGSVSDDDRKKIHDLDLIDTKVSDLTALKSLTSLERLYLIGTQVSDLTGIKSLTSLRALTLDGTQVSDLTQLKMLTNLKTLSLGGTLVRDLTALKSLTNLNVLGIRDTQLSDLTVLKSLTSLQILDLCGTQVSDLTPLFELKSTLKQLFLRNTPAAQNKAGMAALREALPDTKVVSEPNEPAPE